MTGGGAAVEAPLVSILIPAYQRAGTLGRAIDSALAQDHPHLEVVVVDTGSTDGTVELLAARSGQDERLTAVHLPQRLGPTDGWRACLDRSRGSLVKWLWSDDWLDPGAVSALVAPMVTDPGLGFALATFTIHEPDGQAYPTHVPPAPPPLDLAAMARFHSANLPWGQEWLTVSPGAGLYRRGDVAAALDSSLRTRCPEAWARAIGPDLWVQWWSLRSGRAGRYVPRARAHFSAGDDSISISTPPDELFGLYRDAFFAFLADLPPEVVDDRAAGVLAVATQLGVDQLGPYRPTASWRHGAAPLTRLRPSPAYAAGVAAGTAALARSLRPHVARRARRARRQLRRRAAGTVVRRAWRRR